MSYCTIAGAGARCDVGSTAGRVSLLYDPVVLTDRALAAVRGRRVPMRRVATSWKLIEGVLRDKAPAAYRALRPPAAEKQIRRLQEVIGRKLPRSFVSSLRIHDGMSGIKTGGPRLVQFVTLMPAAEIVSEWRVLSSMQRQFGPDWSGGDSLTRTRKVRKDVHWRAGWVPIMSRYIRDHVVLDLDPGPAGKRGQLFFWYLDGLTGMEVVAASFAAWLDALAEELVRGRFMLDQRGDIRLRRQLA